MLMKIPKNLLIAEDDVALGGLLKRAMVLEGHHVELVCDGDAAIVAFHRQLPDLAVIDLGMPKLDGLQVLKILRCLSSTTPVMVLTGAADLESRLHCFSLGADDCLLKPFALRELRARCNALLRRNTSAVVILRHEDLEINRLDHSVRRAGVLVELTKKEYELLECLMLNEGKCVSRAMLMEQVWKSEAFNNSNVVDVYINYLRRKLSEVGAPMLITTVRGEGYRVGSSQSNRSKPEVQA